MLNLSKSCSSRLILEHKNLSKKQENLRKQKSIIQGIDKREYEEQNENRRLENKAINESIKWKLVMDSDTEPKIIGEEMNNKENKMTQWTEITNDYM